MTKRLKVCILSPPPRTSQPWQRDVINAVSGRHDLSLYDKSLPLLPQFEGRRRSRSWWLDGDTRHGGRCRFR
jgi:hypothetical protein